MTKTNDRLLTVS